MESLIIAAVEGLNLFMEFILPSIKFEEKGLLFISNAFDSNWVILELSSSMIQLSSNSSMDIKEVSLFFRTLLTALVQSKI